MKVIFLGCGYLGYNLSVLLKKEFETAVLGIDSPYVSITPDFTEVDVFDADAMAELDLRDAIVVDCIGLVATSDKSSDEEELLNSLENRYLELLRTLKNGGIRRFVFFSSGGTVYGPSIEPISESAEIHPATLYARSKTRIEAVIQDSKLDYLILRVANPYGGYQEVNKRQGVVPILIRRALAEQPFEMWVDGKSTRDYLYITDFARALTALIQKDISEEVVNVGSGIGVSMNQVLDTVSRCTGKKIQVEHCASDVPMVESIVLDISKLTSLTGFVPEISFEQGVEKETRRIEKENSGK
ncbi:MAG: NAD-dependent epimerase/dehydratase family protein [Solobacterium sp.]|jgi:UDP-glucose 4-epimerase|nr:NAD-dependent epimerase/dehydratase family protein [Solobacterium sp.]MCH4266458.1 NAD-dependent epimerase/dehydratase family protein [Solobacterium sp.]